jgi:hypothetical protein
MACLPLRGVAASGLPLQQCAQGARRIRSLFTAPAPSSSPFTAPVPSSTRVSASPAIATLPFFPWDDSQCSACQWEGSRRAAGPRRSTGPVGPRALHGLLDGRLALREAQDGQPPTGTRGSAMLRTGKLGGNFRKKGSSRIRTLVSGLQVLSPFTTGLWTHLKLLSVITARLGLGCEPSHVACDDSHVAPWASGLGEGSRHPEIS